MNQTSKHYSSSHMQWVGTVSICVQVCWRKDTIQLHRTTFFKIQIYVWCNKILMYRLRLPTCPCEGEKNKQNTHTCIHKVVNTQRLCHTKTCHWILFMLKIWKVKRSIYVIFSKLHTLNIHVVQWIHCCLVLVNLRPST